jgi:DNA-binding CsgD family transcriptional regulator
LNVRKDIPAPSAEIGTDAWYRGLEELIDNVDGEDLPARLIQALTHVVPFECATMFFYRGRSRPLHIYDTFEPAGARKGIAAYIEKSYVLNPFYLACAKGIADGVYRIRDLAPDAFFESDYYHSYRAVRDASEEIGYITEDWPEGLEEIDIAVTLDSDIVAELSVYRALSARGFSDRDLTRIRTVLPVIGALLRRYWQSHGAADAKASPPDRRVDDAFADFGKSVLTDREREVAQLILRGHSSESMCFNLGISLGTVKTHRKNAYAKLRVSSQSELLSLFLESLE